MIARLDRAALAMGASETFSPDEAGQGACLSQWKARLDAVVDAVGQEAIINQALPLVKLGGSVCVYGVIDQPAIRLNKNEGPYNFNLLIHQWPTRAREAAAQEPLCEWIRQGKLGHQEFLSAEFPLEQIQAAFALSATGKTLKTLIRF
jgi:Zn-dependent alcohol dehydrogenase